MIRGACVLSLVAVAVVGVATPGAARAATIIVDHTSTDAGVIPSSALDTARAFTMNFSHASVGSNMWAGLGLLRGDDSTRYSFPSWSDNARGNPGWQAKVDDFETWVADHASSYTVFLNKFCYIDQGASFTYYRDSMVKLAGLYPTKTFVWFTIPLTTSGSDNALRATFNASVRAYVRANGLVLFDIADIESHEPDGTAVTSGGSEAMFDEYSTDGGHLNAAGERRMAGAMWHLMARIGGWAGSGGSSSSSSSSGGSSSGGASGGASSGGCATAEAGGAALLLLGLVPARALLRRRRRGSPS